MSPMNILILVVYGYDQGIILNYRFIFLTPPPPSLFEYFFPKWKAINVQPFFLQFCKFAVNWWKNMHTFTNWGGNIHFPPLFHPFQSFYFPNVSFVHIFAQKSLHPWLWRKALRCILYVYTPDSLELRRHGYCSGGLEPAGGHDGDHPRHHLHLGGEGQGSVWPLIVFKNLCLQLKFDLFWKSLV